MTTSVPDTTGPAETTRPSNAFGVSRTRFEQVCSFLTDQEAGRLTHSELEQRLSVDVRELVRQLYQDHLDLRATRECRLTEVVGVNGSGHLSRASRTSATVATTAMAPSRDATETTSSTASTVPAAMEPVRIAPRSDRSPNLRPGSV